MNVLVRMLNPQALENLRNTFRAIDKDNTGQINVEELQVALEKANLKITAEEVGRVIDSCDYAGNGKINYSEFLAATLSVQHVLNDELLYALFKHFDTDNSGYITCENLEEAFKAGKKISSDEIKEILESHDIEKDGRISLEEFKVMFKKVDLGVIT